MYPSVEYTLLSPLVERCFVRSKQSRDDQCILCRFGKQTQPIHVDFV